MADLRMRDGIRELSFRSYAHPLLERGQLAFLTGPMRNWRRREDALLECGRFDSATPLKRFVKREVMPISGFRTEIDEYVGNVKDLPPSRRHGEDRDRHDVRR